MKSKWMKKLTNDFASLLSIGDKRLCRDGGMNDGEIFTIESQRDIDGFSDTLATWFSEKLEKHELSSEYTPEDVENFLDATYPIK